jgi:hypothetical protein
LNTARRDHDSPPHRATAFQRIRFATWGPAAFRGASPTPSGPAEPCLWHARTLSDHAISVRARTRSWFLPTWFAKAKINSGWTRTVSWSGWGPRSIRISDAPGKTGPGFRVELFVGRLSCPCPCSTTANASATIKIHRGCAITPGHPFWCASSLAEHRNRVSRHGEAEVHRWRWLLGLGLGSRSRPALGVSDTEPSPCVSCLALPRLWNLGHSRACLTTGH